MTVLVWMATFVAETMWPSSRAFSSHELVTSGRLEGRLIDSGTRAQGDAKKRGKIPRFGFVRFPAGHDVAMGKRFGIAGSRDRELTATGVAAANGTSPWPNHMSGAVCLFTPPFIAITTWLGMIRRRRAARLQQRIAD